MEKKNKLRAGRICVGATINSLAATSAFVVIALMLYELTGKLNVPYSTLSVAYTFAYAGMMLASFFGGKIITRHGRLGPVISTSAALFGLLSLTYTNSVYGYTRFPTFAIPALREMGYEKEAQLITVANPARFLSHS